MNTKRFVTLLNKAPYVLFTEVDYDKIPENILLVISNKFNLSNKDTIETMMIMPGQDLRGIIKATTKLPDPLAYKIVEALAGALPNLSTHFPVHFFTKNDWQNYIEWQNVDTKPAPLESFIVTVAKFTHKLSIEDDVNNIIEEDDYEGMIHLDRADPTVPLPLRLLKECVIDLHDIMTKGAIGKTFTSIAASQYMSVMQTGYDTFYYINMKKLEKELRAVLEAAGITIEE